MSRWQTSCHTTVSSTGSGASRSRQLKLIAPDGPVYQAGTLSGNPLAVTAGIETLKLLKKSGVYRQLEERGRQLGEGLSRAAREAGRDPREIRRLYNVQGAFTSTTQGPAADTDQGIVGPPEHWVDVLTHFALDIGFSTFVLVAPPDPHTLTTFIEEVAPRVREHVTERRASSSSQPTTSREAETQ